MVARASSTSSSSLARSSRTFESTATSGLFLAPSAINQLPPLEQKPLTFLVRESVRRRACLLGQARAKRNGFNGRNALFHSVKMVNQRPFGKRRLNAVHVVLDGHARPLRAGCLRGRSLQPIL